jgi:hypothetical protein
MHRLTDKKDIQGGLEKKRVTMVGFGMNSLSLSLWILLNEFLFHLAVCELLVCNLSLFCVLASVYLCDTKQNNKGCIRKTFRLRAKTMCFA